ncbi:MAG TPA: Spy/CpxP family protein refolding chaperone [Syntrophorhabdales bacterium]|nr:Spy/CpxP family protein refolding chaperone [Syntrophorhabdales bacterium]
MKRSIGRLGHPIVFVLAAASLCAMAILGSTSVSKADDEGSRIDERIKAFHSKLGIMQSQEERWNRLAQVMRENGVAMHALIQARKAKGAMNAVDDLKSYSEIQDAEAAGLRKFIPPFEDLYASMSDAQKKNADKLFTKVTTHKMRKKK